MNLILNSAQAYIPQLVVATLLSCVASVVFLINPWLAGQLAANLLDAENAAITINQLFPFWMAILVVQAVVTYVSQLWLIKTSDLMWTGLLTRTYKSLLNLPLSYSESRKKGEILALFQNDCQIITQFTTNALTAILPQTVTFIGALVLIFTISPRIGVAAVLLCTTFVFLTKFLGRSVRGLSKKMIEKYARISGYLTESIALLPTIKTFVLEQKNQNNLNQLTDEYIRVRQQFNARQLRIQPAIKLLGSIVVIGTLWVLSSTLSRNLMSIAELTSLLLYGLLMVSPMSTMASLFGRMQNALSAAERLEEFFDEKNEAHYFAQPADNQTNYKNAVSEVDSSRASSRLSRIEFHNVDFAYDAAHPVLSEFNLTINSGETIAIVGRNGSGKSTIAKLCLGLMPVTSGQIRVDNQPIENIALSTLRRSIGYVAQDALLFNNTVRNNLILEDSQYGTLAEREPIDDARLESILNSIGAENLIAELNDGLDTLIGDQGVMLSGGQRQKIALARAVLKNPSILILDEATSMFDPESEKRYVEACTDLLQRATVLLITHRPASLGLADRTIQL